MRFFRRPVSLLLSLIMILSIFTIIPVTTASADDTVTIFADKWVKGTVVTGKYYRFSDLYSKVKFIRANPDVTFTYGFEEGSGGTWNQTDDLSLSKNKYVVNNWPNNDYKFLGGYWDYDTGRQGDGYIYLSDELNSATADWYGYTWQNFTATQTAAASPTYDDTKTDPYQHGNIAYYVSGSRKFKAVSGTTNNGVQKTKQVTSAELIVPYFEFEAISGTENVKLVKCNSADEDIIIPDTVPSNYPDSTLRGKNITAIEGGAFLDNTTVETVTMGNNITSIGEKDIDGDNTAEGAFQGCTALEEVTVGYSLNSVANNAFVDCGALVLFDTTSVASGSFGGLNISGLTISCYHNSELARTANSDYSGVTVEYIDASFSHAFFATWHWNDFGSNGTVTADLLCTTCGLKALGISATISQVVDTPATDEAAGSGHYLATVEYNDQTFTDTDSDNHTYTIPRLPHTHTDANNQTVDFEPWTSSTSLPTSGSYFLTRDVTVSSTPYVTGTLNLCLNGYGIFVTGQHRAYHVASGATMSLYDCNGSNSDHYVTLTNWRGTAVSDSGTESAVTNGSGVVKVTGGYITGGYATETGGGAFRVDGTFNMYGGTLIGNYTKDSSNKGSGGAIWSGGSTTIAGNSRITCNYAAEGERGGVYISSGSFYISGAPDLRGNSGRDLVMNGNTKKINFTDFDPDVRIGVVYYTLNPSDIVITSNAEFADDAAVQAVMSHSNSDRTIVCYNGQAKIVEAFTVTWKDWNDTTLETDTGLLAGATPEFNGVAPRKASDSMYSWKFEGWRSSSDNQFYAKNATLPEVTADVTYTAVYNAINLTVFCSQAISLHGDIGIIYYIDVTAAGITNDDIINGDNTLSLSFSWNEENPPYSNPSAYNVTINSSNYSTYLQTSGEMKDTFKVQCNLCVAEMSCVIKADAVIGGTDYSESKDYSVRDYCMTVIASDPGTFANQDKLVALCKHMLNYGAQAQIEFGIKTNVLANKDVTLDDSEIINVDWSSVPDPSVDINGLLSTYGLKYEGSSLIYLDKTTLRHYFTVEDAGLYSQVISFKIGDKTVTPFNRSTYVCIERSDIAAAELDDQYSITVNNDDCGAYGPMNYCLIAANHPSLTNADEKALAVATYNYNQAANAYFV